MLASLACAPRRLACRYWAGRVALRETARLNIVPQVREEVKRLNQAGVVSWAALRCSARAVRDSTLLVWYRSLYAPRMGGAYDSHHRTTGTAGRARRRGGGMAAGGA